MLSDPEVRAVREVLSRGQLHIIYDDGRYSIHGVGWVTRAEAIKAVHGFAPRDAIKPMQKGRVRIRVGAAAYVLRTYPRYQPHSAALNV